ncbi:LOW QUALITY PROTEIN: heparan-sulfate 6-O-sulfotransferase 1-B-like [Asterias amurensis]|uniref:LOW QUALITY PROTEIN: heparan-sulfate 6-O-sulfotransferase 1-B-like n=1 Tax=Asterias amurensis TaxID=7602 RepID=UPI003AB15445
MANYYFVGLSTIVGLTILSLLYDSFDMDMYMCKRGEMALHDTTREFTSKNVTFDIYGKHWKDVIVFVHIQKTGGSNFGRHLKANLMLEKPCVCQRGIKACNCSRPGSENEQWLFSEYSVGWACGVHADWTEMVNCVPSMLDKYENVKQQTWQRRRYFYVTVLREPFARFLSEWQHVQRGATWFSSLHMCNGHVPTEEELPLCYKGASWENVSLDEFLSCPFNLATNRQTRMLADLTKVGCYSSLSDAETKVKMLESAKENLRRFAFFGLLENQLDTQLLFEDTFKLKFKKDFDQRNDTYAAKIKKENLTVEQIQGIYDINAEDFLLYDYARDLFKERVSAMRARRKTNISS